MKCYRKQCQNNAAPYSIYCSLKCTELDILEKKRKEKEHEDTLNGKTVSIRGSTVSQREASQVLNGDVGNATAYAGAIEQKPNR
ncbi:MAG: hypothetical protein BWY14_01013 [Parcubacteria group bacterium ADurb.Bin192]|nr:MAG: hypothetical protein BWY14_01013 [Parcubacteria group bacterium ADurb.Bin192]